MFVAPENTDKILRSLSQEYLELIILPTEKCNFRCTYCYEDFAIGRMQKPVIEGIKQLIEKRFGTLKFLKISWFGGEPILASQVIEEISLFVQQKLKQNLALSYEGAITTNAYLLDEGMLKKLCELGIRDYQISLDGLADIHDATRKRADGGKTFATIWSNLLSAKKTDLDFKIMLRIHVTPENLSSLPALVADIKAAFAFDRRFVIFFKAIEDLGGPHSKSFNVLHGKPKTAVLAELNRLVGDEVTVEKIESRKPYICYAAQANSFVIRATGRIAKCTVALNDERNDIGYLMTDGTIKIDNTKLQPWIRGLSNLELNNLACPMMNFPTASVTLGQHAFDVKVI